MNLQSFQGLWFNHPAGVHPSPFFTVTIPGDSDKLLPSEESITPEAPVRSKAKEQPKLSTRAYPRLVPTGAVETAVDLAHLIGDTLDAMIVTEVEYPEFELQDGSFSRPRGALPVEQVAGDTLSTSSNERSVLQFIRRTLLDACGGDDVDSLLHVAGFTCTPDGFKDGISSQLRRIIAYGQFMGVNQRRDPEAQHPWVTYMLELKATIMAKDATATAASATTPPKDPKGAQKPGDEASTASGLTRADLSDMLESFRSEFRTEIERIRKEAPNHPPDQTDHRPKRPRFAFDEVTREFTRTTGSTQAAERAANPFMELDGKTPRTAIPASSLHVSGGASATIVYRLGRQICENSKTIDLDNVNSLIRSKDLNTSTGSLKVHTTVDGDIVALPTSTTSTSKISTPIQLLHVLVVVGDAFGDLSLAAREEWFTKFLPQVIQLLTVYKDARFCTGVCQAHVDNFLLILRTTGHRPILEFDPSIVKLRETFWQPPTGASTGKPKKDRGPVEYTGSKGDVLKDIQCNNAKIKRRCAFNPCPFSHKEFPAVP